MNSANVVEWVWEIQKEGEFFKFYLGVREHKLILFFLGGGQYSSSHHRQKEHYTLIWLANSHMEKCSSQRWPVTDICLCLTDGK